MRYTFIFFLFVLFSPFCISQSLLEYSLVRDVPLIVDSESLQDPWAGGINGAQVNSIDFSGDGIEDLVIWERFSQSLKLFEKTNEGWYLRPEYTHQFPEIFTWVLLRDMNNDGKKDLLTNHPLGMSLYINTTPSGSSSLSWRKFDGGREIRTQGINGPVNIVMNPDDIPGIADVDGDGMKDIITFSYLSNTLEYNKNVSTGDSLIFERISAEWGDFALCSCGIFEFSGPCEPQIGGRTEHAGAKAIFLKDLDGDDDMDLVISEDECNIMFSLENIGDISSAQFRNPSVNFPNSSHPASSFLYPAAYEVDINQDGREDLLLGVHLLNNTNRIYDFRKSLSYYQNTSSTEAPTYQYIQDNFLQDQMLDLGEGAVPTLFDIDSDGDDDLFVGRTGEYSPEGQKGSIQFYRNIGDGLAPVFQLVDDDWLDLSTLNLNNIKPQFIDINGDKNIDLAMTASIGREFRSLVLYLLNKSFWEFDYETTFTIADNVFMQLRENALFHDLDNDGDADLLIVRQTGAVEWFEFDPNQGYEAKGEFLGLGLDPERSNGSISISDLDMDGSDDLLISRRSGLDLFRDYEEEPLVETIQLFSENENITEFYSLGSQLKYSPSNIFNDDLPSFMVGTGEGGVYILRNRQAVQRPLEDNLYVKPNLIFSDNETFVELDSDRNIAFDIINLMGQQITPLIKVPAGENLRHSLEGLSDGMYLVRIFSRPGTFRVTKIVVSK